MLQFGNQSTMSKIIGVKTLRCISDGISHSMAKHFHEELESFMQGEAKLFPFGSKWSISSRLGIC